MVSAILRVAFRDVPAAALSVPRAVERVVGDQVGRATLALVDSALASARDYAHQAAGALAEVADTEAGTALVAASDHLLESVRVAAGH